MPLPVLQDKKERLVDTTCIDDFLLNDWYVVADLSQLDIKKRIITYLFDKKIKIEKGTNGSVNVYSEKKTLPIILKYGFIWTSLGCPKRQIIDIPEAFEMDRHIISGGATQVNTSGLRVVENFLDQGHLSWVHPGFLGEQPHTEIPDYNVEIINDEIFVSNVKLYQPKASTAATEGFLVAYEWRVYRPLTVALYKANSVHKDKKDYIVLFIQPINEENCIVHSFLCYLSDGTSKEEVRWFMQVIFMQDKPILENQIPKKLPLAPRAETPIKSDKVSIVYRRWLNEKAIKYGAIIND